MFHMKILRNWSIVLAACAMACVQEAGATGGLQGTIGPSFPPPMGDPEDAAPEVQRFEPRALLDGAERGDRQAGNLGMSHNQLHISE